MPFHDQGYNLKIGNEIIERIGLTCKDKYKFVGVKFDEFLNWNYQISNICAKLSSASFALKSVKKILPLNIRKIVYESLIKSQSEYGMLAWGSSTNQQYGLCQDIHSIPILYFLNLECLKQK